MKKLVKIYAVRLLKTNTYIDLIKNSDKEFCKKYKARHKNDHKLEGKLVVIWVENQYIAA